MSSAASALDVCTGGFRAAKRPQTYGLWGGRERIRHGFEIASNARYSFTSAILACSFRCYSSSALVIGLTHRVLSPRPFRMWVARVSTHSGACVVSQAFTRQLRMPAFHSSTRRALSPGWIFSFRLCVVARGSTRLERSSRVVTQAFMGRLTLSYVPTT